ncbi:MAG: DUF4350 domain-containing protein [Actinomycetota bacterium]|nr:DUF4350 domain-containing protein [Actinomycetota bacterium]
MNRVSSRGRLVIVVITTILALNYLAYFLDRLSGARPGPTSSSYTTSSPGAAAYASLLERFGHPVDQLRQRPSDADLDPTTALVLLEPDDFNRADGEAVRAFVESGGVLIAGGSYPDWLDLVVGDAPPWSPSGPVQARPLAPRIQLSGIDEIATAGRGSFSNSGSALPLIGEGDRSVVALQRLGDGDIYLLADTSWLQNRLLDAKDNAALGVALAGENTRNVLFAESVHGFGGQTGFAAIPSNWKWALAGLLLAALVLVAAKAKRLGPPEQTGPIMAPARRLYVESMAGILARSRDPVGAFEPLRAAVNRALREAKGLPGDASDDAVLAAARKAGLSEQQARALTVPVGSEAEALWLGTALVTLRRQRLPSTWRT